MSPTSKGTTIVHRPRRCCGGLGSIMGSIVSTGRHHTVEEPLERHERPASQSPNQQQVVMGEMERELEKQKELRMMYKNRMERTQDYLKFCLQVAQDNGFLHLIVNNGSSTSSTPTMATKTAVAASLQQAPCLLPPPETVCNNSTEGASPLLRLPLEQPLSDLTLVVEQAKYEGWYVEPDEVELEEEVARGTTAEIYRATWRGSEVAVKRLFPDFFCSNPNGAAFFAQEVETLSRQRHRFVLRLVGACLDLPDQAWIVTEFLETTMKEWLHGCGNRQAERSVPLPPLSERVRVAVEIAQAMQYLHGQKPKVIHRDLKPSNVFLDDGVHVRVADFGHARFLRDEEMALTGETGE
ncbi:hypothetical protein MLD38_005902 [Melastoma candidum]|uniref:Uncharacterized protein n=1 Tax=Melastoma candidum TaxID=119954 RepID=A0ACB9RUL7_9MYRT|nr:hypothetical protein MLD38_005902 [Melastoma candidum]